MTILDFFRRKKDERLQCDELGFGDNGKPVIMSGPGGFLTKTRNAREPRHDETMCTLCFGDGWDADSGGRMYVCPRCSGAGVIPGNTKCMGCGHERKYHYADGTCLHGNLLHGKDYDINKLPCSCRKYVESLVEEAERIARED